MQKRTLYLSLLLASFLLVFTYSFGAAQTVTFESKNVPRCSDVILNITVNTPQPLSAFEIIFTYAGNYTGTPTANFSSGLTFLNDRILPTPVPGYPNTVRMAALKIDAGDPCLPMGTTVVGQIHFKSADVCNGTITVVGATVTGSPAVPCNCPNAIVATTGLVACSPAVGLTTTVVNGTATIANQNPTFTTCPGPLTYPWGTVVQFDVKAFDPDSANGCETKTFSLKAPYPTLATINPTTGHVSWPTAGDDVCNHTITVVVTDKCGATAECAVNICVTDAPPVITYDPAAVINAVWDITLSGQVVTNDPDGGPHSLLYSVVSFNGPTYYGNHFNLNTGTGAWTWDIPTELPYLGDFTLCIAVTDGANLCSPCNPTNADTACYKIHVTGFAVTMEKVHQQLQGHNTTAIISFEGATEYIGGFDFLVAYDASALTFINAEPGALIDNGKFEYFTYRFGPNGNCGNGCPSGMLRIVGMREYNNGVINPNHISGPGELVILNFFVTNDRTLECQFVPIRFYWLDCGDNVMASEDGNFTWLGFKVYDFEGNLLTNPADSSFGFTGADPSCYDTVFVKNHPDSIKNFPLGAIIFKNGGIDIICADSIDARGDVNLNHIPNEIGDAVVFTNYFINGLAAFTINVEGQIAATEVNGDGIALSVADLVYLIRIIVGDASPLAKISPDMVAQFTTDGQVVRVNTPTPIGAALFVFDGQAYPTLANAANGMEIKYGFVNNETRILVYSMDRGRAINSGDVLNISGSATLRSVEAATYEGAVLATNKSFQLPTEFALNQNYPNPFNPVTTIELALPTASDWTIAIFNVSGQKVAEYSGHSEAGIVTVNWDASNLASGLYFYKANAGNFSATKKMVLLK